VPAPAACGTEGKRIAVEAWRREHAPALACAGHAGGCGQPEQMTAIKVDEAKFPERVNVAAKKVS